MKIPQFRSFTQLLTFTRCPRQYLYSYKMGLKIPPDGAMIDGISHHRAVEAANRQLLESRAPTADDLMDWRQASFDDQVRQLRTEVPEAPAYRDAAAYIYRDYVPNIQNTVLRPRSVEARFTANLLGREFVGVIDLVQDDGAVFDYKRTTRRKSTEDIARSPQLHLYGWTLETDKGGHIQFLVKGKRSEACITPVEFGKEDMEKTIRWAGRTMDAIDAASSSGVWSPCAPDSWVCCPRFCGYYRLCQEQGESEEMARIKLATSKYLSAAALESVVPCRATITTVQEELVGIGAAAKNEWVVYLKAEVFGEKGLVLNATNRDALCALFGDETDDWTGKELTLTVADTIYAGKPVRGVRVAA